MKHPLLVTDQIGSLRLTAEEKNSCLVLLSNWLVLSKYTRGLEPNETSLVALLKLMRHELDNHCRTHILERLRRKIATMRTVLEKNALLEAVYVARNKP